MSYGTNLTYQLAVNVPEWVKGIYGTTVTSAKSALGLTCTLCEGACDDGGECERELIVISPDTVLPQLTPPLALPGQIRCQRAG